jgi:predicted glycosyltransferase
MKSIILDDDDDEVEPLFVKYAHPFADVVLSPDCLTRKTNKLITYPGYHELAYLHPNRFTPDENVLKEIGLKKGDVYFILRFNAFKAHHDVDVKGLSSDNKRRLIEMLEKKGKVFITTERNIDDEFKKYQLKVSPEKAHSLIYYATMLIGDSQTMTSEAAVLGTPAIRCNTFVGRIAYLEEEEHKYNLTYGFHPDNADNMFLKINELLETKELKALWNERRIIMLKDKIDVTAFFVWFIENYPESSVSYRNKMHKFV